MMLKRVMVLGVMASALVFTGCQDRNRNQQDRGAQSSGDQAQQQPATGGSGTGSGVPQDARPGTELGGTDSSSEPVNGTGGSGLVNDQGTSGAMDQNQDTSGAMDQNQDTSGSLNDPSGVGGSGTTPGTLRTGAMDGGTGGMDAGMR